MADTVKNVKRQTRKKQIVVSEKHINKANEWKKLFHLIQKRLK